MRVPSFESVIAPAALSAAWARVQAKGARGGYDGVSVETFALQAGRHLERLHHALQTGRYAPEPLVTVRIPKAPGSSEYRTLSLPTVRDKVVQAALRDALEPLAEPLLSDRCYGYRPRRGPQRALRRVLDEVGPRGKSHVAVADIDDFFPSIDHARLHAQLRTLLGPEASLLLDLLARVVSGGMVDAQGRWQDATRGLAQGSVLSPLLSNLYLTPLDTSLAQRGVAFVRYADNLVLFGRNEQTVASAWQAVEAFVQEHLGLRFNSGTVVAPVTTGFTFLGVTFEGSTRRLCDAKRDKLAARLAFLVRSAPERLVEAVARIEAAVAAWRRYYGGVLPAEAFEPVEGLVSDALARLLTTAFREQRIRSRREAETLLRAHRGLFLRPATERPAATAIARAAYTAAFPAARPARPTAPAVVRRRKQAHARRQAATGALVVTEPGTFLGKRGPFVEVREGRRTRERVLSNHLTSVTVATHGVALSSDVVALCAEKGVPLLFIDGVCAPEALLTAPTAPNVPLAVRQVGLLNDVNAADALMRAIVRGKLHNAAALLKYVGKYAGRDPAVAAALDAFRTKNDRWMERLGKLPVASTLGQARAQLLPLEGRAARAYWSLVQHLLGGEEVFPGRVGRGASDLPNALLNYGYAVLRNHVHLALRQAGLAAELGLLHAAAKSRPALAFDLMEVFRSQVVDRTALALLRRRMALRCDDAGRLDGQTRRTLVRALHQRLAAPMVYRARATPLPVSDILRLQAEHLAEAITMATPFRPWSARW